MDTFHAALLLLFGVIILILLFLAFRAIVLWYWRINESIRLLGQQKILLDKSVEQNARIIALLEKVAGESNSTDDTSLSLG